jgi:hypothetical protein
MQSSEANDSPRSPWFTVKVNLPGYTDFFWASVKIGIVGLVAQRIVSRTWDVLKIVPLGATRSAILAYIMQVKSIDTDLCEMKQYIASIGELKTTMTENEAALIRMEEKASEMKTKMDTIMGDINKIEIMLSMIGVAAVAAAGLVGAALVPQRQQKQE